jgi:hypothetical protein
VARALGVRGRGRVRRSWLPSFERAGLRVGPFTSRLAQCARIGESRDPAHGHARFTAIASSSFCNAAASACSS